MLQTLIVPGVLVVLAAVLAYVLGGIAGQQVVVGLQVFAVIVVATAIGLSWWFHANRTLLNSLIVLTLILYGILVSHAGFRAYRTGSVYLTLQFIVPLLFVAVSCTRKRRIVSPPSLLWVAVIVLSVVYVGLLPPRPVLAFPVQGLGHISLLPAVISIQIGPLSDLALLLFAAGAAAMFKISLDRRNEPAFSAAWIGAYVAILGGLYTLETPVQSLVWFSAAAVSIVIALIQHAYSLAFLDELTRVPNRRALFEQLSGLGSVYALAMVDIDHFKKFNDTHGHEVGDQVLRKTATQLQRVGGGGKVYRYGGEEFTIVFAGKTAKEAGRYCKLVRQLIAEEPFYRREPGKRIVRKGIARPSRPSAAVKPLYITVSMGVSEPTDKNPRPDDVLKIADQALYMAKKQGRNRVVAAI